MHVCMYVCMYGCVFHCALRYEAKTWHVGRGRTHGIWEHIFEATRPKVIQRSSCFRDALWPPNLVRIIPDWNVMHCLGQRSGDQPGSTRGQLVQECLMATKFGRTNPWPMWSAMLGSKVIQGSTRDLIAQECPMATKFGRTNPWLKCSAMLGSKVRWGVNLRSNCSGIHYGG